VENPYRAPNLVTQAPFVYGGESLVDHRGACIITEGELKARAAIQLGLPAIALPGMNSSRQVAADLLAARQVRLVYVIFDTDARLSKEDKPKSVYVDHAVETLTERLGQRDLHTARVTLPLLGEQKMDLDRYILLMGPAALEELRRMAREARDGIPA